MQDSRFPFPWFFFFKFPWKVASRSLLAHCWTLVLSISLADWPRQQVEMKLIPELDSAVPLLLICNAPQTLFQAELALMLLMFSFLYFLMYNILQFGTWTTYIRGYSLGSEAQIVPNCWSPDNTFAHEANSGHRAHSPKTDNWEFS